MVSNQPEWRLRRTIGAFFTNRSRNDLLLLHFSCHGVKDDSGQLYFATTDTDSAPGLDRGAGGVRERQDPGADRGAIVLLLDCCYSGAFARGPRPGGRRAWTSASGSRAGAGSCSQPQARWSMPSRATELARAGRPSVFTRALVRGLETGEADRDGDGRVSVDELYDYVYEEVRTDAEADSRAAGTSRSPGTCGSPAARRCGRPGRGCGAASSPFLSCSVPGRQGRRRTPARSISP